MWRIACALGLATLISHAALAEDLVLEGTYKLISSTRKILSTGETVDAYGKHPTGYISYGRDGRMSTLIVWDKDDRPSPKSVEEITDEQRVGLFRTMLAYGGTYTSDGHTVSIHIDISSNQAWTGTTLTRDVRMDGDKLVYTTRPAPFSADGKVSVVTLLLERVR